MPDMHLNLNPSDQWKVVKEPNGIFSVKNVYAGWSLYPGGPIVKKMSSSS